MYVVINKSNGVSSIRIVHSIQSNTSNFIALHADHHRDPSCQLVNMSWATFNNKRNVFFFSLFSLSISSRSVYSLLFRRVFPTITIHTYNHILAHHLAIAIVIAAAAAAGLSLHACISCVCLCVHVWWGRLCVDATRHRAVTCSFCFNNNYNQFSHMRIMEWLPRRQIQKKTPNSQTNDQRRDQETVQHTLSKGTAATGAQPHPHKQSADFQPNSDTMSSELCKNIRDRLGLWGTVSDAEVAGNVTGLDRLRQARFNKVRSILHLFIYFCLQFVVGISVYF